MDMVLVAIGFVIVFGAIPFGIGLKFGRRARSEHGKFDLGRIALVCAGLAAIAAGPFLYVGSGLTALHAGFGLAAALIFCTVGPSILGWCLGYLGFNGLIAAPLWLCLFFGLPLLGAFSVQWWRSIPQDRCAFDPVSPDVVQQMREKLAEMRGIPWFEGNEAKKASIIARIEALAPPGKSTIHERLAATHLVMRNDGFVLGKWYAQPGNEFAPVPDIDRYLYKLQRNKSPVEPEDIWNSYLLKYIGPPYYAPNSPFGAWSETRIIDILISHRAGENVRYDHLRKELKCTDASILIPGFKGPNSDWPVSRDYSCPKMPSAEWVYSVPDRVCHIAG